MALTSAFGRFKSFVAYIHNTVVKPVIDECTDTGCTIKGLNAENAASRMSPGLDITANDNDVMKYRLSTIELMDATNTVTNIEKYEETLLQLLFLEIEDFLLNNGEEDLPPTMPNFEAFLKSKEQIPKLIKVLYLAHRYRVTGKLTPIKAVKFPKLTEVLAIFIVRHALVNLNVDLLSLGNYAPSRSELESLVESDNTDEKRSENNPMMLNHEPARKITKHFGRPGVLHTLNRKTLKKPLKKIQLTKQQLRALGRHAYNPANVDKMRMVQYGNTANIFKPSVLKPYGPSNRPFVDPDEINDILGDMFNTSVVKRAVRAKTAKLKKKERAEKRATRNARVHARVKNAVIPAPIRLPLVVPGVSGASGKNSLSYSSSSSSSKSGPKVSAASGPKVSAASGPKVSAASGPKVSAASGPKVSAASGANVSAASGANVSAASGANVSAASGANVSAASGAANGATNVYMTNVSAVSENGVYDEE